MPGTSQAGRLSERGHERRAHRRVDLAAGAWLIVDERRLPAECTNVSMGGASVRSQASSHTGGIVRLELALGGDEHPVSISCEVVRKSGTELGLRFLALDRTSLEAILSLL
jgi:hypothetical protein